MKNIPIFTTEYGTASLILREIPYKREAYILNPSALPGRLRELALACGEFCRAAGAERVYLAEPPESALPFPLHTEILTMTCPRERLDPGPWALYPVLPENVAEYRRRYNEAMAPVANAATMERADEARLLEEGGAYFVHWEGRALGLGQIQGEELRTVVSFTPGGGEAVVRALSALGEGDTLRLKVASQNQRALGLYHRLGFSATGICSRWLRIFPEKV